MGEQQRSGWIVAAIAAPLAGIAALIFATILVIAPPQTPSAFACGSGNAVAAGQIPDEPIEGYAGEQLGNAAAIMAAAAELGMNQHAQLVAVMTAMGESSLRVLDHGDTDGPDSRGLFQQRESWGPLEVRMDPAGSARLFLERLAQVEDWEQMEPTLAASAVQRNADPYHYERFWPAAQAVVRGLAGDGACIGGLVSADGWARPADGPVTSPYGWRVDPISGDRKLHEGTDFDGACGDPLWAAGAGTVSGVFQDQFGAWIIEIDHGGGVTSWTVHMEREGVLVQQGQQIAAGEQIGLMGSSGYSTGCHLHYELRIDGEPADPMPFLTELGVAS